MRSPAAAPRLASVLKLKWPNDLLLDGAKLAGILIEAESIGGTTAAVAVGIGVELRASSRADWPIRRPVSRRTARR